MLFFREAEARDAEKRMAFAEDVRIAVWTEAKDFGEYMEGLKGVRDSGEAD